MSVWGGVLLLATLGHLAGAAEPGPAPPAWTRVVDLWWDVGTDRSFESVSVDVAIDPCTPASANVERTTLSIEVSCPGRIPGSPETYAEDDMARAPGRLEGPGLRFSIREDHVGDAIGLPHLGLEMEAPTLDRVGQFAPHCGRYTCRLAVIGTSRIDGRVFTRVSASTRQEGSPDETVVGIFRILGDHLVLRRRVASSIGLHAAVPPAGAVPKMTVRLSNLRVNGKPVDGLTALAEYPEQDPGLAEATGRGTSVVVTRGAPIKARPRRRVDVVGELANRPPSELSIGKFDLLATFTYAKSLRDGFSDSEAKVRGITAAVMGARARGVNRAGLANGNAPATSKPESVSLKRKQLTPEHFDRQVSERMGEYFTQTFLPTMQRLVKTRLTYEKLKKILSIPPEVGAKITMGEYERRASGYLKDQEVR
jgi:hypothetical protein